MKKIILIVLAVLLAGLIVGAVLLSGSNDNANTPDDVVVENNEATTVEEEEEEVKEPVFPEESLELEGGTYVLTFFDDFDGDDIDPTKWERCPEQKRPAGYYWDDDMVSVVDGNLVMTTAVSEETGRPIAGGIRTKGLFEQSGGYFEIKCTVQDVPGYWSAFWLMCDEQLFAEGYCDGTAKDGAEIDIFEACHYETKKVNQNIHFDGYGSKHVQLPNVMLNTHVYDGGYHTFALLWTKDAYIFFIDGKEVYRVQEGDGKYPGFCEPEMYLKISAEIGTWAGNIKKDQLPNSWKVDYVRVYQLSE